MRKEYCYCPHCANELDTGWDCNHCGADWEAEATGLNPSEAVYGFAAWLTTRDEVTTMSARHDSGVIADLVKEFCAVQGLPPISHRWPGNLRPADNLERTVPAGFTFDGLLSQMGDFTVRDRKIVITPEEHILADEPGWNRVVRDTMRQMLNTGSAFITVGTPPSDDGYDSLRAVLAQAVEQASGGKGTERHSNGQPFDQQPICQGGRRFGICGLVYQCWKKSHEVPVLMALDGGKARAVRELLGVINYAAAAILVLQEGMNDE